MWVVLGIKRRNIKKKTRGSLHSSVGLRTQGSGVWEALVELRPAGVWEKPWGEAAASWMAWKPMQEPKTVFTKWKQILLSQIRESSEKFCADSLGSYVFLLQIAWK